MAGGGEVMASVTVSVRARVLVKPRWWLPVCVIVMEGGLLVVAWLVPTRVERELGGLHLHAEQRDTSIRLPSRVAGWLLGPSP